MGLDFIQSNAHWSYSGFHQFRERLAKEIGIAEALGPSRQGRLAMWQVIARVVDQGSRLSAVRLATSHAACDVLGFGITIKPALIITIRCCPVEAVT